MALVGALLALGPLLWVWRRHRHAGPAGRLRALTLVTLFLTFDLVLFGAFTRLTDSGLGCPDWPGCYGNASPFGARHEIQQAQMTMPTGPVTHGKAWIEMVHRYLATGVGALITAIAAFNWWLSRRHKRVEGLSPWLATLTFVWVCVQGAFGALTVTMKLYPAIVTGHLLLGLGLLVLLALQAEAAAPRPIVISPGLRRGVAVVALLAVVQIALGGWVSTNYAVLACSDFPTCQGEWVPPMDFEHAFTFQRGLGQTSSGDYLPFAALTAIHWTHRLMALVVLTALFLVAWRLWATRDAQARRFAGGLVGIAAWQLMTGLSNVVLGWPLLAAAGHTGGAALLAVLLARLMARCFRVSLPVARVNRAQAGAGVAFDAAS